MKHYSKADILSWERLFRTNLINGISGCKPTMLLGTSSSSGDYNLALFSSVVHVGANPPLLGVIMRPPVVDRHTLENIRQTGIFTMNHVHAGIVEQAHHTSAKYKRNVSEFEKAGLTAAFLDGFTAPYVAESKIRMGLQMVNEIPIPANGTLLIVGEVLHLYVSGNLIGEKGMIDMQEAEGLTVSGLNTYYTCNRFMELPFARPEENES
ncbi:MAG: flavin reductase family protein [bacterium]